MIHAAAVETTVGILIVLVKNYMTHRKLVPGDREHLFPKKFQLRLVNYVESRRPGTEMGTYPYFLVNSFLAKVSSQ